MAYERVNWENLPSTKTPINQTNLNKMENGIDQAGAEIFVGAEEPTAGEKVWFNKDKNSIYVRNKNGLYEEFIKKQEEQVLWTNPSPSLSFSEQTISIDLSKYSKIYIVYKGKNTDTNFQVTGLFDIGKKYFIKNASFLNFTRPVEVTQNSVIFNSDYFYNELGNTATTIQNDYNIPYQIIGLKEV